MRSLLSLSPEPNEVSHFSISGTALPPEGDPVWGKYGFVFVRFRDQGSLFLTMVAQQLYSHSGWYEFIPGIQKYRIILRDLNGNINPSSIEGITTNAEQIAIIRSEATEKSSYFGDLCSRLETKDNLKYASNLKHPIHEYNRILYDTTFSQYTKDQRKVSFDPPEDDAFLTPSSFKLQSDSELFDRAWSFVDVPTESPLPFQNHSQSETSLAKTVYQYLLNHDLSNSKMTSIARIIASEEGADEEVNEEEVVEVEEEVVVQEEEVVNIELYENYRELQIEHNLLKDELKILGSYVVSLNEQLNDGYLRIDGWMDLLKMVNPTLKLLDPTPMESTAIVLYRSNSHDITVTKQALSDITAPMDELWFGVIDRCDQWVQSGRSINHPDLELDLNKILRLYVRIKNYFWINRITNSEVSGEVKYEEWIREPSRNNSQISIGISLLLVPPHPKSSSFYSKTEDNNQEIFFRDGTSIVLTGLNPDVSKLSSNQIYEVLLSLDEIADGRESFDQLRASLTRSIARRLKSIDRRSIKL